MAIAGSIVISGGVLYAQNASPRPVERAESVPAPTAPAAPLLPSLAAQAPTQAELLAASAPVDTRVLDFPLDAGVAPEQGLQIKTIWVARAISMMYPEITTIGGYRQDALKWHPNGLAIDVMIPDHNSDEGIELGNQIAGLALANAERWGVIHVIWRQGFYPGIGAPSWTADYGSETLNHFDHIHIATDGGGYPTGRESYYLGSMKP
ncbi:glycoside hydrolase [Mycobacterium adipatum]|uniref:Glycoside hydrolase n=1 Tax=Mycobacterium adipatum TaxID=1682113 RepID=A0A172UMB5_9MYCO|nr:glycoside hydrolase [Mycobacterium adipatum]ANE80399.1 glycoside hydrolase [Mycobacterium adipatum]